MGDLRLLPEAVELPIAVRAIAVQWCRQRVGAGRYGAVDESAALAVRAAGRGQLRGSVGVRLGSGQVAARELGHRARELGGVAGEVGLEVFGRERDNAAG